MAQQVRENIIGVDVAKEQLQIYEWTTERSYSIANTPAAIAQWLARWAITLRLAVEPTNTYHRGFPRRQVDVGEGIGPSYVLECPAGVIRENRAEQFALKRIHVVQEAHGRRCGGARFWNLLAAEGHDSIFQ